MPARGTAGTDIIMASPAVDEAVIITAGVVGTAITVDIAARASARVADVVAPHITAAITAGVVGTASTADIAERASAHGADAAALAITAVIKAIA
jgi:hypothetical protein